MQRRCRRTSDSGMMKLCACLVRVCASAPAFSLLAFSRLVRPLPKQHKVRAQMKHRITCLASRPSVQRQGHGTALMRFVLDKAAKDGHNVRLASQERCSVSACAISSDMAAIVV